MRTGPPNYTSPIRSQAQFEMLTKVASDPQYAAARGMAPETASQLLKDHAAAGAPPLVPGRIGDHRTAGATPRTKKHYKLLKGH